MESETIRRPNIYISILLCAILFLFSCAFTALQVLRLDNAAYIIRNTDISWFTEDPRVPYYIEHQLSGLPFHETEISVADVEDFIKTRAVSRGISSVIDRYAGALAKGNYDYYLTTDEIFDISKSIEPELNDLFSHQMTDDDHERLARTMDDIVGFRGLSVGDILYDAGPDIERTIPFLAFSPYLLVIAGLLGVITLCIIFLHHSKKISGAFLYAGIAFTLSGLVFLTVWVIYDFDPQLYIYALYALVLFTGEFAWGLAGGLAEGLVSIVMWYGIGLTSAGVLSVAAYFVLRSNLFGFAKKNEKITQI